MKKKTFFSISRLGGIGALFLLAVSCAQDGFDDETFGSSVRNTTLESPILSADCFSSVSMADGSEKIKVTWKVIEGAGGYHFQASNIDDPQNPVVLTDTITDGCSMLFDKADDTKYSVSIQTLGNDKYNNKDAVQATIYAYSTLIDAIVIPNGSDIAEFINQNIKESENEQAFELEANGQYTLDGIADFGLHPYTLRGNKIYRPIVKVGENGGLMTQAGLKVKWINFDCTNMTKEIGLIGMGKEPSETLASGTLIAAGETDKTYKDLGANQNTFIVEDPIIISECMVKNLPNSLLYGNKKPWALKDFRVQDCIVQLNNSGSHGIINLYGGNSGGFLSLSIRNNSFINLADNNSAFTLRLSSASNAVPKKLFGDPYEKAAKITIDGNTWVRCMNGKDFGNNMVSNAVLTFSMNNNIFYDTWRIWKAIGNCTKDINQTSNTVWGIAKTIENQDKTTYCTEEEPGFIGPFLQELDLTQPNGGINLKATGTISGNIGDPRWRE